METLSTLDWSVLYDCACGSVGYTCLAEKPAVALCGLRPPTASPPRLI